MRRYYEWDDEKKIVIEYRRVGECKKCGVCCMKQICYRISGEFAMQKGGKPFERFPRNIGMWSEINTGEERLYFNTIDIIDDTANVCTSLDENGLCKDHNKKSRKIICKEWPYSPKDLEHFPNCGYSFEKIGEWTYDEIGEKAEDLCIRKR